MQYLFRWSEDTDRSIETSRQSWTEKIANNKNFPILFLDWRLNSEHAVWPKRKMLKYTMILMWMQFDGDYIIWDAFLERNLGHIDIDRLIHPGSCMLGYCCRNTDQNHALFMITHAKHINYDCSKLQKIDWNTYQIF